MFIIYEIKKESDLRDLILGWVRNAGRFMTIISFLNAKARWREFKGTDLRQTVWISLLEFS